MIKTEQLTINGKGFVRTYSDTGMMIERDGVLYDEAYDPAAAGREYTETDQPPREQAEFEPYNVEVIE